MDERGIIEMCERLGWKPKRRNDWISVSCPFAKTKHEKGRDDNPSFGISIHASSPSRYNCMACGQKGPLSGLPTVLEFMKLVGGDEGDSLRRMISDSEKFSESEEDDGYLVDRAPGLSEYTLERFQKVRKSHLASRGIDAEAVSKYDLMWDRSENRLLFTIRDGEGRLVGIRGRFLGNAEAQGVPRYKEYVELSPSRRSVKKFGVWYGMNNAMVPDKALILLEGEIDLIRLKQVLPKANVLASIGATIPKEQLRSLPTPDKGIVAFFDNDMAGKNAFKTIQKELHTRECKIPLYRVTNYSGENDPDGIIKKGGKEAIIKALQSLDKAQ